PRRTSMTEAYRIVIGMDLEDEGDHALMEGLRIGEPIAAGLHAVHVIPTRRDTEVLARVLDLGLSRLRERVAKVAVSSPVEVRLRGAGRRARPVAHAPERSRRQGRGELARRGAAACALRRCGRDTASGRGRLRC